MKILYVNHVAHIGGAEHSLAGLLTAIQHKKDIDLLVVLPERGSFDEMLSDLGIEVQILRATQINLTHNPFRLLGYILNLIRVNYQLYKLIRKNKIDLIHANSIKAGIIVGIATKISGKPLVWHIRDYYEKGWIRRLIQGWAKLFADRVIAISQKVASMFDGLSTVNVVYNGVDISLFSSANMQEGRHAVRFELGIDDDICLIGMVGQIAPWKGQDIFLQAMEGIIKNYTQTHFVLVGDAYHTYQIPYREQLISFARERLPDGTASFLGWRKDILSVMAAIDILVHPAKGEPFGRVVIEAMAAGKPVVGTNSGGLPEIIEHNKTGILVEINNPQAIADAVTKLLSDVELCQDMGRQGRYRVEQLFSLKRNTEQIVNIYHNLIVK